MGHRITSGMRIAAALLSVLVVSGCVTSMRGYSGVDDEGKRDYLTYAAAETPVCLTSAGSPFAGGDRAMALAAAEYASGAILRSSARFTVDCAATAYPDYRIVIHANRVLVGSPDQLCGSEPLPKRDEDGRLRLDAAFCSKGEPLSTAWSEASQPTGTGGPVFRQMIRSMVNDLFPIERDRERNNGSFRLSGFQ